VQHAHEALEISDAQHGLIPVHAFSTILHTSGRKQHSPQMTNDKRSRFELLHRAMWFNFAS